MAGKQPNYKGVLKRLEKLIDEGEYPPGGRLPPVRDLKGRFGVGRSTVREAIIALEALGRVEVNPGSGIYVLGRPAKKLEIHITAGALELTEACALVEGEAAAFAATMISDEELVKLETVLLDIADESADGKFISELAVREFHHVISEATRNNLVSSVIDNLRFVFDKSPDVHIAYRSVCDVEPQAQVDGYKEILEALKRRDPQAARDAMHSHFARILNELIAANEKAQTEEIRRRAVENRERFSLNRLAGC